jgi:hypothetical protein
MPTICWAGFAILWQEQRHRLGIPEVHRTEGLELPNTFLRQLLPSCKLATIISYVHRRTWKTSTRCPIRFTQFGECVMFQQLKKFWKICQSGPWIQLSWLMLAWPA